MSTKTLSPWKVKIPVIVIGLLLLLVIWRLFGVYLHFWVYIIAGVCLNFVLDVLLKAVNNGARLPLLFSFEGRIDRSTFWAIYIALIFINVVLILPPYVYVEEGRASAALLALVIGGLSIVIGWIATATFVKRWHDLDKSGWMTLTLLIPIVNVAVLLYLGFSPGVASSNKYGTAPSYSER